MRQILCPTVLGRDDQLAVLEAALASAAEGNGGVVLVTGEAGVGKSRLALEAETRARSRDIRALRGRALPSTSPLPFRAVAEALASVFRAGDAPDRADLGPYAAALGRLIPEWAAETGPALAEPELILHEAVVRLLRLVARERPVLLILEDLHWADSETLALLEYLADNLAAEAVLCLGTLRSDEESAALSTYRRLHARRNVREVSLDRLSPPLVDAMARACLDAAALPRGICDFVWARTEGTPFLVEEVLATCLAAGGLVRDGASWRLLPAAGQLVPETVRGLVAERLELLGEHGRHVLYAAALLGRQFEWTLLPALTGFTPGNVLTSLREAVSAQLVSPDAAGDAEGFRFRHALTRDAVLAGLLPAQRRDLAGQAAACVEEVQPGPANEWRARAAELWAVAGDRTRAARLLLESGRAELARGAFASAESMLERARALDCGVADLAVAIDEEEVQALSLAGKPDDTRRAADRAAASLKAAHASPSRIAAVQLAVARAESLAGRWDDARRNLEEAEQLASSTGDHDELIARISALRAQVEMAGGDHREATRLASEALAIAERTGPAEAGCEALDVLGRQAQGRQQFEEALGIFARAARLAEDAGLTLWRIRTLLEVGTIDWMMAGRIEQLQRGATLAETSGALSLLASIEQNLSWPHLFAGELDALERTNARCIDICRTLHLELLPHALVVTAGLRGLQNRYREMDAALTEAESESDDANVLAGAHGWRGMAGLLREDRSAARAEFDEGMAQVRDAGRRSGMWLNWHFIGTRAVLLELEDPGAKAREELRTAPMARSCWNEAALHYADAIAAGRAGHLADAEAEVAHADSLIASAPLLFNTHRRLVAEAAAADGWGDPTGWLNTSLAFYGALGQERAAAACRGLLRKAGAPLPRRRRARPGVPAALQALGVTAREMDVLGLITEGMPNPEIAGRLFMSTRTVESHVASLLRRTSSRNRGQLISVVTRLLHEDAGSPPA